MSDTPLAVACGRDFSCVQTATGITCFGDDEALAVSGAPAAFAGTLVGAGGGTVFALDSDDALLAWGSNRYGLASPLDAATIVDVATPLRSR